MTPHPVRPTDQTDLRGVDICECGSTRDATVHSMPEIDEEMRAMEARKLGEEL